MTAMDVRAELIAPCTPAELFSHVDDLAKYPAWLEIVSRAEPLPDTDAESADRQSPAWAVDLRGRLGPLARSKRLRMVRTELTAPTSIRFERAELDGRDHSPWILTVTISDHPEGAFLTMDLHYGGSLFASVLEPLLRDEITRSKERLLRLVG